MGDILIHPTQLYSSLAGLIVFFILMGLQRRDVFDGLLTGTFFILDGLFRFFIDFYRYYEQQMYLIDGLEFNQIVSLLMFFAGIAMIIYQWKKRTPAGRSVDQ